MWSRLSSWYALSALLVLFFFGVTLEARATETNGVIQEGNNASRICRDAACSLYGQVNWTPVGAPQVTVRDDGISGYAWGNEIGWINLSPIGAGVSVDPDTGELSGYAYSNTGSWVNFAPTQAPGGEVVGVRIGSEGQFSGWAWVSGAYGGWMEFDCNVAISCVTTDWRPIPDRNKTFSEDSTRGTSRSGSSVSGSNTQSTSLESAPIRTKGVQERETFFAPRTTAYTEDQITRFYRREGLMLPGFRYDTNTVESYTAPLVVRPSQNGLLVWEFPHEDVSRAVVLEIPAGAVSETTTFFIEEHVAENVEAEVSLLEDRFVMPLGDTIFLITMRDPGGEKVAVLQAPIRITLVIPELTKDRPIAVRTLHDGAVAWEEIPEYDRAEDAVSFWIAHLSYFGVFAEAQDEPSRHSMFLLAILGALTFLVWVVGRRRRRNKVS